MKNTEILNSIDLDGMIATIQSLPEFQDKQKMISDLNTIRSLQSFDFHNGIDTKESGDQEQNTE